MFVLPPIYSDQQDRPFLQEHSAQTAMKFDLVKSMKKTFLASLVPTLLGQISFHLRFIIASEQRAVPSVLYRQQITEKTSGSQITNW